MMNEKKYLMLILLLAAILLIMPSALRMLNHNDSMVNSEAYYNLRIYNQDNAAYDYLQGHPIPLDVINFVRLGDSQKIAFSVVPIILGIATIFFLYLILNKHNIPEKTVLTILLLITVSPIFIYTFTDFKIYSFIIFFCVLGLYFLTHNKSLLSSISFALIPFIDLFSGIITLALLIVYMFTSDRHRNSIKIISIALLSAILLSFIMNIYYNFTPVILFKFGIQNVLTDIGAEIGFSFAIIILTAIGLILLWENGLSNFILYACIFLFIIAGLFNSTVRIYSNFIIMIFAGFAIIYLNRRKWSINIIKKTTVLLIICSIFFSSLVYMTKVVRSEPTPSYIDALKFVRSQSLPNEVILCSPSNGYFIEYYTNRMVFIDDKTQFYDKGRFAILENLTTSRSLEKTEILLQKYNIKYVIIDDSFEPYLTQKEGLLFLIENSQKFTNIYASDEVNVWLYNGQTENK